VSASASGVSSPAARVQDLLTALLMSDGVGALSLRSNGEIPAVFDVYQPSHLHHLRLAADNHPVTTVAASDVVGTSTLNEATGPR
jgi:hypothetical protein